MSGNSYRFKKISVVVRVDERFAGAASEDVLQTQMKLASIGLVRQLSFAILQSLLAAASDDGTVTYQCVGPAVCPTGC